MPKELGVLSLGRLFDSISATRWVSFWDLNGPIITALEQINGDLAASAPFTMGDGKGVTRCTKTLWRRWQVQPLCQKSVFLQKVWLWQEAVCKVAGLPFHARHNGCITCSKSCTPLLYGSKWLYFVLSASMSGVYNVKTQWQLVDKPAPLSPNMEKLCYRPCHQGGIIHSVEVWQHVQDGLFHHHTSFIFTIHC